MEKLITFAVPCYNSEAYMDHCIGTLLTGGEDVEIILVDDGSTKDNTPAICDRYAEQYPDVVRAIHQPNGGHGEGVNQGIRNARGLYYKVVDSDDWLDTDALQKVLAKLREFAQREEPLDLMICNYVYEHVEAQPFIASCDRFIYIEVIRAAAKAQAQESQEPPKQGKKKSGGGAQTPKVPGEMVELIADSLEDLADEEGYCMLSEVGTLLLKKQPDFDSRNFGFKNKRQTTYYIRDKEK